MYKIDNWMESKDTQFAMPNQVMHRNTRIRIRADQPCQFVVMLFPVIIRGGCYWTTDNRDLIDCCAGVQRRKKHRCHLMRTALSV